MQKKSLEHLIKKHAKTPEEKEELVRIVDEIIHHRIIGCILDNLPAENHAEFINKAINSKSSDEVMKYLEEKTVKEISQKIKDDITKLEQEILKELD